MDLLELKRFMVLLWKNFILKRRQCTALVAELILTVLFVGVLLLTRRFAAITKSGPFKYSRQPVNQLPVFLKEVPSRVWEMAFVPSKSVVVKDIVETVKRDLHYNFKVQGFPSERDFEDYVKQENNSERVMVAFVFDHEFKNSHDPLPLKVKYYLRFSSSQRNMYMEIFGPESWETDTLFPKSPSIGPRNERDPTGGSPGYISEGFLLMQHALDKAIMKYHNRKAAQQLFKNVHVFVQRFPYPAYYYDFFYSLFTVFAPLVILFIFIVNYLTIIQSVVWEKENRLKEYQLMIGLSNWMLWAAYFFTFLTLYMVIISLTCLLFYVKMEPVPIIQYSDPSLVFVFLLCFAISTILFSFMVSTFFNKAHLAISLGGFIYIISYFPAPRISSSYAQMTLTQKLAFFLSSNVAMALGTKYLVRAEIDKVGIKWSNIFSPNTVENFVFAYILGIFLLDAVLYGLVAWYIEAVFPGEYGVPKPWNFFLLHSYWFGEKPKKTNETKQFYEKIETKYFEVEPTDLVAGIQLQRLCKEFRVQNTTKIAVKDLSLNLYEGQITVLLGHNGAGKSTTLSILSGLYPATSGEAYVNGYAISKQMVQIRKSLGLCPQQDLLFNYLTVAEHLYFYCVIKGIPRKMHPKEIDRMLSAFNLLEKRNAFSVSLSGGMKRRLSIIIALIGDSKVVILDEPTAGMDPASRRATWDLLQQYKQGRTVLLTTHYMDEADVLGDRIAIMVKGSLRCCGSSFFLKEIYGVGYHIVIVKEPHCNVEEISKLIYYHIPSATLEKNVMNELSFILPKDYTHRFEALFTDLERRQTELGIASFGASITTIEEVFFRVNNMEESQTDIVSTQPQPLSQMSEVSVKDQNRNMSRNEGADSSTVNERPAVMFNTGCSLYHQQFRAMFIKRAIFNWRNWKLILLQILALLGSLTLLSESVRFTRSNDDEKSRLMSLSQYGQTIVPLSISGNSNLTLIFLKHLKSMLEPDNHTLKEVQGDLLKYLMENEDCIHLCIVAFSIEVKKDKITFTGLFNNQAYHSPSLSLAMIDNILFMSTSGPDASITVINKPQPTSAYKYSTKFSEGEKVAINIHFGMALLVSGFCLLTVTERITKAKHIQFMSGVYALAYWLSALLWDLIIFFVACCLLLGVFKFCQLDVYLTDYHFLDTMLIFMLFGWSAIPLIYLLSFLFSKSTSAYIKLVVFGYLSGIFSLLIDATFQFEIEHMVSNSTKTFILRSLLLLPNYNLAKCIINYFAFYDMKKWCSMKHAPAFLNCDEENASKTVYSLEEKRIGLYMVMMSTIGFVYLLLVIFWDTALWKLGAFLNRYIYFGIYKTYQKGKVSKELSGECKDEDVENERKRILGQPQELLDSSVLIKELIKVYFKCPVILAVKNISITIQKGECFGLLGLNGAGKTTTFQILTGEENATSGHVFIDGFSITNNIQKVKSRVGYCPQSDALLEYMTGQEIMIMYARLWGISESQIQLYVSKWLTSLQLESHADRIIRTYSGGNKRRLSTAIALMGKPTVILLDEPSTGMDPVARRLLWDALIQARESGKTIIITSHRMEECDAFCTRLAIMVKGKFVCLGSPQHLKNKFGNVYILKVKVKTDTQKDKLNDFKNFITMTFPGSELKQENQGILNYYIPSKDNSWSKVFGILEEAKEQFNLEDYSVSQITLEQVFLTFANLENNGLDDHKEVP
ncbi:phospholipid-transporting ATPase ABCA3-like [Eptesicus fuscus]|uniref:phospholipid-transporting ATPase ABCA3-like n=1 Tax=Eptesicus fuscus TaxID=29078 RepID=UPI0024042AB2|nr:phospholipid-transporting ATPase ABCA3-like [Eptesicus fuscus]